MSRGCLLAVALQPSRVSEGSFQGTKASRRSAGRADGPRRAGHLKPGDNGRHPRIHAGRSLAIGWHPLWRPAEDGRRGEPQERSW